MRTMNMGASNLGKFKDDESYLESLIVNHKENMYFKNEIVNLLCKQIYKYTGGDSSVSKERAQSLLDSILYVISLYLKCFSREEAQQIIQNKNINELYQEALMNLRSMMNLLSHKVHVIQFTMSEIEYNLYCDTLIDGFNAFIKYYNYEYNALDSIITFDYPTFLPIQNKTGIEQFQLYIKYIEQENDFCHCFDTENIQNMLINYSKHYQLLIFNISELILKQVLLKGLLQHPIQYLVLEEDELMKIYQLFKNKSQMEVHHIIVNVYQECLSMLNVSDFVREYFYNGLNQISSQIFYGCQHQTLEKELSYVKNHSSQ